MKTTLVSILLALMLFMATLAQAFEVQFTYNGPVPDGYRLYLDGSPILDIEGNVREWEGELIIPEGRQVFTLTATYEDGSESAHSQPYEYYHILGVPTIIIIGK